MAKLKTHLRKSANSLFPACSSFATQGNRINHSVSPSEFRLSENTCKACQAIYLKKRNEQRRNKGISPVSVWNEAQP